MTVTTLESSWRVKMLVFRSFQLRRDLHHENLTTIQVDFENSDVSDAFQERVKDMNQSFSMQRWS